MGYVLFVCSGAMCVYDSRLTCNSCATRSSHLIGEKVAAFVYIERLGLMGKCRTLISCPLICGPHTKKRQALQRECEVQNQSEGENSALPSSCVTPADALTHLQLYK